MTTLATIYGVGFFANLVFVYWFIWTRDIDDDLDLPLAFGSFVWPVFTPIFCVWLHRWWRTTRWRILAAKEDEAKRAADAWRVEIKRGPHR